MRGHGVYGVAVKYVSLIIAVFVVIDQMMLLALYLSQKLEEGLMPMSLDGRLELDDQIETLPQWEPFHQVLVKGHSNNTVMIFML
jgi:hypothetical protein